jgi:hypothetical protein
MLKFLSKNNSKNQPSDDLMDENTQTDDQNTSEFDFKKLRIGITYRKIDELKPYENNAREHPPEQIEQIKDSIRDKGMIDALTTQHSKVLAGHGRLIACQELGFEEVPCIELDHLSPAQFIEYVIANNKIALNSTYNQDMLRDEIITLESMGGNTEILGFDENELGILKDGWTSDIEIPTFNEDGVDEFKIRVSGNHLDKDDVLNTINRAIEESGIEGVKIES